MATHFRIIASGVNHGQEYVLWCYSLWGRKELTQVSD